MNLLFVHQNMPGQFRHLAAALAREANNRVVFLTRRQDREIPGVCRVAYSPARSSAPQTHHYLHQFEDAVLHGQAVARACLELKKQGFAPDIVVAHPGWGEGLFVKDIWPTAPLLNYGEFYYRSSGADVAFGDCVEPNIDVACKLRARNAHLLLALEAADHTLCPTEWQKSVQPAAFHDRISVVFDGVDTDAVAPDPAARLTLPTGQTLTASDEVVSYVSRTLEPYRGFDRLMHALPRILARRPQAHIVIAGGDGPGYGAAAPDGRSWRAVLRDQVKIDPERVHFVGVLPYADYLSLLRISSAHVYLTVPFVLSWSMVEAMAAGCLIIGSRTKPVEELIEDGRNGVLVDFFSVEELADAVVAASTHGQAMTPLRLAARDTVLNGYSVTACLPRQRALVNNLIGGRERAYGG